MIINKQNVEYLYGYGNDLAVVNAARVSFDKYVTGEIQPKDEKLISYLAKNKHWTPFAHAGATFRVKAPIFVSRQLVKHQVGLVWNEVSRRYVDSEPEFYFPATWRARAANAKQGSGEDLSGMHSLVCDDMLEDLCLISLNYYKEALERGVAPEQARMMLPQNTMTEWIWTGSLAAWARVCNLRLDPHAQQETRDVAKMISDLMEPLFPVSWKVLVNESV